MSPANVSNFVHDLVEMAKAMETLPMVQAELADTKKINETQALIITSREEHIISLKLEINALNAKVWEAEQGRDAAETMFLECDDKLSAFRRLAQSFSGDLASLVKAQEPPPPVAIPVEEPLPGVSEHKADGDEGTSSIGAQIAADISREQGQSEADPTSASAPLTTAFVNVPEPIGATITDGPSTPNQPYHGLLYIETKGWISRDDWYLGGGNDSTYDWREGMRLPDGFYYTDHGIEYKS